jgi:hypothetical protein
MSSALKHSLELERGPPSLRPFTDQGIETYIQTADIYFVIVTARPQSLDSCSERDSHFADVAPVTSEGYEQVIQQGCSRHPRFSRVFDSV